MPKMIYLDNETATKLDKRVFKAMKPYFREKFSVPLAYGYKISQEIGEDVKKARKKIAGFVGVNPEEIRFTSGTTEANNLALKGLAKTKGGGKIITSPIERSSVLNSGRYLKNQGFEFETVEVDERGFIELEDLREKIDDKTFLVSIQHSNQEIGTVQDLKAVAEICKEKNILLHSDITSSLGKFELDLKEFGVDLASFEADSIYGPKGSGALYIKEGVGIEDLIHGPRKDLRPGIKNIPAIVGFSKATEIIKKVNWNRIKGLRNRIIRELLKLEKTHLIGPRDKRLPTNISLAFKGVEGESLMLRLDMKGIAVRTGSGCTYSGLKASHVLRAIGKKKLGHSTIRMNLGKDITEEEVKEVIRKTKKTMRDLREMSPVV